MTAQTFTYPTADVADYLMLLKPKVMSLVVFTAFAGLVAAPGVLHPVLALTAVMCVAMGAGAAGALNMWAERSTDALMNRTMDRPLPAGRMAPEEALHFAVFLSIFSVLFMGLCLNWVAAGLLAASILFYVFIYTLWLKPRTPQNIVIGGAAGAFPPMIGWAAVTGDISMMPVLLFLVIFFWTPPHFWALALFRESEYAKAGIPMLPVVAGRQVTQHHILGYTVIMVVASVLPWVLGYAGRIYGVTALVLGALFLISAVRLWREDSARNAGLTFGFSVFYLFGLFGTLIVEALHGI